MPSTSQTRSPIPDPLSAAAAATPKATAIITSGRSLHYGELDRLVEGTAASLRDHGVTTGSRVGLCLPNGWSLIVLILAALRAGGVACLISRRIPLQQVRVHLETVEAAMLISNHPEQAGDLSEHITFVLPEDVIRESALPSVANRGLIQDRPATIVFTSGSTGSSKAVLHSFANHYYSATGSNENIRLGVGDRWLVVLPLYHVGGVAILFRCLLAGATVVVPNEKHTVSETMHRLACTHVSLVATQLQRLLGETMVLEGVKAMLLGGSAIPPALIEAAHRRHWPVYTSYGMTEMTSQITTTQPGATLADLSTSGGVLPHRHIKIAEDGEVLVKGRTRFLGYIDGSILLEPFDNEGWFRTGDLGRLDDDGMLRIGGRKDNMFISGGENIHPEEIERILSILDGVQQAVVVPVEDATFGQRPVAFVQTTDAENTLADLAVRLLPLLPKFKIPIAFYAWPDDLKASILKIDRVFFQRRVDQIRGEET